MKAALRMLCAALFATEVAAADEAALAQCAAVTDDAARLACYDALAHRPAAPAPAPATTPTTPPALASPAPGDFGLPKPDPARDVRLHARIAGPFKDWSPGKQFTLDNGQVWQVTGKDSGSYPNAPDDAEVTIRKTFFGGYRMQIQAIDREVKVKRVS